MNNRFIVEVSPGVDAADTSQRTMEELIGLTQQLNAAKIPIVVGPNETLPEGMKTGQPVIDWRSGASVLKVWNGKQLI